MSFDGINIPNKPQIGQTTYAESIWVYETITDAIKGPHPNVNIAMRELAFGDPYKKTTPKELPTVKPRKRNVAKYSPNQQTNIVSTIQPASPTIQSISSAIRSTSLVAQFKEQIFNTQIEDLISQPVGPTVCYDTILNGHFRSNIAHWDDVSDVGTVSWSSEHQAMLLSGSTTQKVVGLEPNTKVVLNFDVAKLGSVDIEKSNIKISIGFDFILVLQLDKKLLGWGQNNLGQLGLGFYSSNEEIKQCGVYYPGTSGSGTENYLENIIAISAGSHYTIIIDENGMVYSWGKGDLGQLGNQKSYVSVIPFNSAHHIEQVFKSSGQLDNILKIYAGRDHTLALDSSGNIWSWGYNRYGQLGNGLSGLDSSDIPLHNSTATVIEEFHDIRDISAGGDISAACKNDGTAWMWGLVPDISRDFLSETGFSVIQSVPQQIIDIDGNPITNVIKVSCDSYSIFMLKSDGTLWVVSPLANFTSTYQDGIYITGSGVAKSINRAMPVRLNADEYLNNVKDIDATGSTVIILSEDGRVFIWGSLAGETIIKYPTMVDIDNVQDISAGNRFCGMVKEDGTLWIIGKNLYDLWEGESDENPIQIPDFHQDDDFTYYLADSDSNIIVSNSIKVSGGITRGWRLYEGIQKQWNSITHNSKYIAASNGSIMVSDDAIFWHSASVPSLNYVSVISGPPMAFIAITPNNGIVVSQNGLDWTLIDGSWPVSLSDGVWGNGKFVLIGYSNEVLTSNDGLTWSKSRAISEELNPGNHGKWYSIAYGVIDGISRFVAVGYTDAFPYYAMTSSDGISWIPHLAIPGLWLSVAYGKGLFVAVGADARTTHGDVSNIMTSVDGINWISRDYDPIFNLNSVTFGGDKFVAVGDHGQILISDNGIAWKRYRPFTHDTVWQDIVYGGGKYVAVAYAASDNKHVMVAESLESTDTIYYTRHTISVDVPQNGEIIVGFDAEKIVKRDYIKTVSNSDGNVLAILEREIGSETCDLLISRNSGTTWSNISPTVLSAWDSSVSIGSDGNKIIVVNGTDTVYVSDDFGNSWTTYKLTSTRNTPTSPFGDHPEFLEGRLEFNLCDIQDEEADDSFFLDVDIYVVAGRRGMLFVGKGTNASDIVWTDPPMPINLNTTQKSTLPHQIVSYNPDASSSLFSDSPTGYLAVSISGKRQAGAHPESRGRVILALKSRCSAKIHTIIPGFISRDFGDTWEIIPDTNIMTSISNGWMPETYMAFGLPEQAWVDADIGGDIVTVVSNKYIFISRDLGISWNKPNDHPFVPSESMGDRGLGTIGIYGTAGLNRSSGRNWGAVAISAHQPGPGNFPWTGPFKIIAGVRGGDGISTFGYIYKTEDLGTNFSSDLPINDQLNDEGYPLNRGWTSIASNNDGSKFFTSTGDKLFIINDDGTFDEINIAIREFLIDNVELCETIGLDDCGPSRTNVILNPNFASGVEHWTDKNEQSLSDASWDSENKALIVGGSPDHSCSSARLSLFSGQLQYWFVSCELHPPEQPNIMYPDPDELGYGLPISMLPPGSKQTYPPFPQYRINNIPTKYTVHSDPISAYANSPILPNLVYDSLDDYPVIQFDYSHLILGNIDLNISTNMVNMGEEAKTIVFVAKLDEVAPHKVYMEDVIVTNRDSRRIGLTINSGAFYSGTIQKMVAGTHHSVILDNFGKVATTGGNSHGQLGLGDNINRLDYAIINREAIDIAAGARHTLLLSPNNGVVYAFGDNASGQLGIDGLSGFNMPQDTGLNNVDKIYAGGNVSFFIKDGYRVFACGLNGFGQLGIGTIDISIYIPTEITSLSDISNPVVEVATSGNHTLFLRTDGTVLSCGNNADNELGLGLPTDTVVSTPTVISGLNNIVAISAGMGFSLALDNSGVIWAWGYNIRGELGLGDTTTRSTPTEILSISDVVNIAVGFHHSAALLSDGSVYTWGRNNVGSRGGQLGLGDMGNRIIPTQVNITNVDNISAGAAHTIASSGDTTYGWGYNINGQLGNGTDDDVLEPIMVASTDKYIGVEIIYGRWQFVGIDYTLTESVGDRSRISRTYIRSDDWAIYSLQVEPYGFRLFENNIELSPVFETGYGTPEHEFTQPARRIQFGRDQYTDNTNARFDLAEFRLYNGNLNIAEQTQLYNHLYDVYFSGSYIRPEFLSDEARTIATGLTLSEHYVLDFEIISFEPKNIGETELIFGADTILGSVKIRDNIYPSRIQLPFTALSDTVKVFFKSGEPGGITKIKNVLLCVESDSDCGITYNKLSFNNFKVGRGGWSGGIHDSIVRAIELSPGVEFFRLYDNVKPNSKIVLSLNIINITPHHTPPKPESVVLDVEIVGVGVVHTFYGTGPKSCEFSSPNDENFTILLVNRSVEVPIRPAFLVGGTPYWEWRLWVDDILVCATDDSPCDGSVKGLEVLVEWDGVPRKPVNLFNVAVRYTIRDWDDPLSKTVVTMLPDNEGVLGISSCITWKQQGIAGNPSDTILKSGINQSSLPNIKSGDIINIVSRSNWIWAIPNTGPDIGDILNIPTGSPEGLIESIEVLLLANRIVPDGIDSVPRNPKPLSCSPDPSNDIVVSIRYISSFGVVREFSSILNVNDFYHQDVNFANSKDAIDYINNYVSGGGSGPAPVTPGYELYDVNGDGFITAQDVLALINAGHGEAWDYISSTDYGLKGIEARWESVLFELDTVDGSGLDQCTEPIASDHIISGQLIFPTVKISGNITVVGECDAEVIITPVSTGDEICEMQSIILPARSAGTWSLAFDYGSFETATLPWNISASELQNILESFSSVGLDNVRVIGSGNNDDPFYIEFVNDLCGFDMPLLIVDGSGLIPPDDDLLIDIGDIIYKDCDGLDVVFCLDDTGSMGPTIQAMKDQVADYTNYIESLSGGNYRLGLILFKDFDELNGIRYVVSMSDNNKEDFITEIKKVVASGGGDAPEAQSVATMRAVEGVAGAWEESHAKIIILISDAHARWTNNDPLVPDEASPTEAAEAAKANDITVCSIHVPKSPGIFDSMAEIDLRIYPRITGGVFVKSEASIAERAIIEGAFKVCSNASRTIKYSKIECLNVDGNPGPYATGSITRIPSNAYKLVINVNGTMGSNVVVSIIEPSIGIFVHELNESWADPVDGECFSFSAQWYDISDNIVGFEEESVLCCGYNSDIIVAEEIKGSRTFDYTTQRVYVRGDVQAGSYRLGVVLNGLNVFTDFIPWNTNSDGLKAQLLLTHGFDPDDITVIQEDVSDDLDIKFSYLITFSSNYLGNIGLMVSDATQLLCDPLVVFPLPSPPYDYQIQECDDLDISCQSGPLLCRPASGDLLPDEELCCTPDSINESANVARILRFERDLISPEQDTTLKDQIIIRGLDISKYIPYIRDINNNLVSVSWSSRIESKQSYVLINAELDDPNGHQRIKDYLSSTKGILPSRI